jgi:hypothetical protein
LNWKKREQDYATKVIDKEKITTQANERANGVNTAGAPAKLVLSIENIDSSVIPSRLNKRRIRSTTN